MEAINWNRVEDPMDLEVWHRLVGNFWVPEKIPVSNDLKTWGTLSEEEKLVTRQVFAGLTLLDTLQGSIGAPSMLDDAQTPHEEAVLCNIGFMEAFSPETQLLTPTGWRNIGLIDEDTQVAQYHPYRGQFEFVYPNVVPSHFARTVFEIDANGARQVVSGGHRVYFEEHGEKVFKPVVMEARDFAGFNGLGGKYFRVAGHPAHDDGPGMSESERMLLAIVCLGGFLQHDVESDSYTITVDLELGLSVTDRFLEILLESGWGYSASVDLPYMCLEVQVPKQWSDPYFWKFISHWSLNGKAAVWLEEFLELLSVFCGTTQENSLQKTMEFYCEENADFAQAALVLTGKAAIIETKPHSWVVKSIPVTMFPAKGTKVREVEPRQVYCVQVPSTYLLTRNGGHPVVSGNCVHAKSYSTIFSTLCSTEEIDEIFRWVKEHPVLQKKAEWIEKAYNRSLRIQRSTNPDYVAAMKKAASVLLESFLFYSGFYLPLHYASVGKLTNTADIIRLILRDEGVHGYYLGYKFQQHRGKLSEEEKTRLDSDLHKFAEDLYEKECEYAAEIYDGVGWTENVKTFMRYNLNKALNNLGYGNIFPGELTRVEPRILSAMAIDANETHDFFSGSGSSYVVGTVEETEDEDWV